MNKSEAKLHLQKQYLGCCGSDSCLLSFIGRITDQKGVLVLVKSIQQVLKIHKALWKDTKSKRSIPLQFIIAGKGHTEDPYVHECKIILESIKEEFPTNIWWDFDLFFTDGPILNVGSDYGLVPSIFEPGGLVQSEFLVMDTPVICSSTGGLKDTVIDICQESESGPKSKIRPNGLLFPPGNIEGLAQVILEAHKIFCDHLAALENRSESPNQPLNPSAYEMLVSNCFESVVDVETMAIKYLEEFHRIKNSIFIPNYNIQIDYIFRQVKHNVNESNRKIFLKKQVSFEGDLHRKILLKIDAFDILEQIQQFQSTSVIVVVFIDGENPFTRQCKFNKAYKDYVYDVFPDLLALEKKSSEIKKLELKYNFKINQKRTVINPRLAVAYDRQIGTMVNVLDLGLVFKIKP